MIHFSVNVWGGCGIMPMDIMGVIPYELIDQYPIVVKKKRIAGK